MHRRGDTGASRKRGRRHSPVVVNRGWYSSDEEDVIILPPPPASARTGEPLVEESRRSGRVSSSDRRRMPAPDIILKRHQDAASKHDSSDEETRSEPVKIVEETIVVPRREHTTYYYDPEKKETTKVSRSSAVDSYTEYVPAPTDMQQDEENRAELKHEAIRQDAKEPVRQYIVRKEQRKRSKSPGPLLEYVRRYYDSQGLDSDADEAESGNEHTGSEVEEADPTFDTEMAAYDDFGFGGVESEVSSQFESFEQPPSIAQGKSSWDADFVNVYSSLYTGDGEYLGHHTAALKVIHGLTGPSRPLFRWL